MGKPYSQDLRERVIAAVDMATVSVSYVYKAFRRKPAK